jgi:Ser/Thr protein kinase RdoA (MazF antagonist)
VPAPLAVNPAQNWMLLEDLGEPLGREAPLEKKMDLFRAMARIQIDSTSRIDRLIQMGCIDRRIPWLQAHLDGLMVDEITLRKLTQAERNDLQHALPHLQSLLTELDRLPIPPSLIHGDLHTGNVASVDEKIQIYDWTDAAISHPFFDLDVIFSAEDSAVGETLQAAYLSAWEEHFQAALVRRAFEIARVVYGLYHAVSYQFILNNLEEADREEIHTAHYFFRQVLKGLG